MRRPATLRGRLAAAMLLILMAALGVAALLDRLNGGRPTTAEDEPYQDAIVLAVFFVPALVLIWAISWWSLRPLARISREAMAVGPAHPAGRLSPAGLPREIVPLVDAVNAALDRMAGAFEAERQFTENAAHELRTPLAVLGLRLQRARSADAGGAAPDWTAIEADLAQINRLVSQLLDLARKENAGRASESGTLPQINLSRIVREACAAMLPMIERHGRTLSVMMPEKMLLHGDAADLHDVMRNLLENALFHGSGAIAVWGHLDAGQQRIIVHVSDEGAGFSLTDSTAAFARFAKGRSSRGSGLGLAIVREVLRSLGGDVSAMPGPPGRIELYLPALGETS